MWKKPLLRPKHGWKDLELSQWMIKSWQWILAHYSFVLQGTKSIHAYNRSITGNFQQSIPLHRLHFFHYIFHTHTTGMPHPETLTCFGTGVSVILSWLPNNGTQASKHVVVWYLSQSVFYDLYFSVFCKCICWLIHWRWNQYVQQETMLINF